MLATMAMCTTKAAVSTAMDRAAHVDIATVLVVLAVTPVRRVVCVKKVRYQ